MNREELVQRMDAATLGVFDIASTYLGVKLGLYRSLAEDGPATPAELAARTGTNERLVREWLEQQGATELLDATNDGGEWRFALPSGHAAVLLDPDALDGVDGTVRSLIADLAQVPRLVESFRTGEGIPYADYGPDEAEGQALGTRPVYRAEIKSWLAAVPEPDGAARVRYRAGAGHRLRHRLVERLHGEGPSGRAGGRRRPRSRLDRGGQTGRRVRGRDGPRAVRAARRRHLGRSGLRPRDACSRCSTTWPGRSRCSAPPGRP